MCSVHIQFIGLLNCNITADPAPTLLEWIWILAILVYQIVYVIQASVFRTNGMLIFMTATARQGLWQPRIQAPYIRTARYEVGPLSSETLNN